VAASLYENVWGSTEFGKTALGGGSRLGSALLTVYRIRTPAVSVLD